MLDILYKSILCALFNRARGSQFASLVPSTGFSHIVAPLLMALTVSNTWQNILIIWLGLVFWCVWGWDAYWGACNGNEADRTRPEFAPVDWILAKLAFKNIRIHGIVGMGLRQGLCAIPLLIATGQWYLIPIPFLFGLPYYGFSLLKTVPFVQDAELLIGLIWGVML